MTRYIKLIVSLVASIFVLNVGCAQTYSNDRSDPDQNHPTALNTEIIVQDDIVSIPMVVNTAIERMVPYKKISVWNTPIGPLPKYDPHSDEMIGTIGLPNDGQITSDPTQFSYTLYFIDEYTPRRDVPCIIYKCSIVIPQGLT